MNDSTITDKRADGRAALDVLWNLHNKHWMHWPKSDVEASGAALEELQRALGVSLDRQKPLSPPATLGEME